MFNFQIAVLKEGPWIKVDTVIHYSCGFLVASCTVHCTHNLKFSVSRTYLMYIFLALKVFIPPTAKQYNSTTVTKLVNTFSLLNHLPEDGHFRSKRGISYIYDTIVFLLLCSCWNKYRNLDYCTLHICYVFLSASLCAVSWLTFRNLMYCNIYLDLKHVLRWNVLV